ncbi:MAG: hypothetical protein GXO72_03115 [Caldiserica bacterium]|nr:hypothetical protein [Caldisericota bacterium]
MKGELLGLIELHRRVHPAFGVEDLAKLVYQGVFGADHLLSDPDRFAREFLEEWRWAEGRDFPDEPLFEPVDPRGRIYRLNLRPAKRRGVDPEALLDVLLSQPRRGADPAEFWERWRIVVELAAEGAIPFHPDRLRGYGEMLAETGIVPRHSVAYRRANRPRYRLINDLQDEALRGGLRSVGLL